MLTFAIGVLVGAVVASLFALPHVLRKVSWRDKATKLEAELGRCRALKDDLINTLHEKNEKLEQLTAKNLQLSKQVAQMSQR